MAECKLLEVAEVMVVRRSEIVTVAHPEMEKLDTYAVELNVLEVRPKRGAGKKDIVGEERKLMEGYHMRDN